jgi:hypothetical protein
MNIPIKQLKKWIAALDSGEYKQAGGALQSEYGHCCLGVACKVIMPEDKLLLVDGRLGGGTPSSQPNAPSWLIEISYDFEFKTGKSLIALNDHFDYTFSEIATLLELVYIHKILD